MKWKTSDEDEGVQAELSQVDVRISATSIKTSGKSKAKKQQTVESSSSVSLPASLLTDSVAKSATQSEPPLNQADVKAPGQAGKGRGKKVCADNPKPLITHLQRRCKANNLDVASGQKGIT